MANKKKTTKVEEIAPAEKPEAAPAETTAEPEEIPAVEEAPVTEETPAEESESKEAPVEETTYPYKAKVTVPLAILRRSIGPGTADMLKPVATLKQGTEITIAEVCGENARLSNGLWIALDHTEKQ